MQLYFGHYKGAKQIEGNAEEAHHIGRTRRKRVGDLVFVSTGDGKIWKSEIETLTKQEVIFNLLELESADVQQNSFCIAVAPTKKTAKMEWFLEKACEIGIGTIHFMLTKRTERPSLKTERLHKIAVSAMKQSLSARLPEIKELASFESVIESAKDFDNKFIAKFDPKHESLNSVEKVGSAIVLIGPEGDFTDAEYQHALDNGFIGVNLSGQRLRTETAALVSLMSLHFISEKTNNE